MTVNGLPAVTFHNKRYVFTNEAKQAGISMETFCASLGNYQPAYLEYMEEYEL